MEEISWWQKSKTTWLKEGDRNTRYFHHTANMRNSINLIHRLKVGGDWIIDQAKIRDCIEEYYRQLYMEPFPKRPEIEGVDFDFISEDQRRWLERPFSKEEVKLALNSMKDDKAPGPNGFLIKFLKVCWDVVDNEAMATLEAFHTKDQWCKSLSATFITLIPKKEGAAEIKYFRPISLVGCLNKLLSKTLAIRLKIVMHRVISRS